MVDADLTKGGIAGYRLANQVGNTAPVTSSHFIKERFLLITDPDRHHVVFGMLFVFTHLPVLV